MEVGGDEAVIRLEGELEGSPELPEAGRGAGGIAGAGSEGGGGNGGELDRVAEGAKGKEEMGG